MVGDGEQDALAGRAAGALTVGVRGGFSRPSACSKLAPTICSRALVRAPALVTKLGVQLERPVIRGRDLREAVRQERLLA